MTSDRALGEDLFFLLVHCRFTQSFCALNIACLLLAHIALRTYFDYIYIYHDQDSAKAAKECRHTWYGVPFDALIPIVLSMATEQPMIGRNCALPPRVWVAAQSEGQEEGLLYLILLILLDIIVKDDLFVSIVEPSRWKLKRTHFISHCWNWTPNWCLQNSDHRTLVL